LTSTGEIEKTYGSLGGRFICTADELKSRLEKVKAFVLDWDGVFNNGRKSSTEGSDFSEVDSMGLNLLRYAYFLRNGAMPVTLIISGEKNESAFHFCEREGLTYSFYKIAHKIHALDFLCEKEHLQPAEVAYFFDDVLDIPIAEKCGLRMQVNQRINPLFTNYCVKNGMVDYLTASAGGQFAVREAAELLIGLYGNYEDVINGRIRNVESYQDYIGRRRKTKTQFLTLREGNIELTEWPPGDSKSVGR
jgi:3-deoxy-D-manno-octulosonate 8-phosphate phosphatase (KDO 8-P phosphatase)